MTVDGARTLLLSLLIVAVAALAVGGYLLQNAHIDTLEHAVTAKQAAVAAAEQAAVAAEQAAGAAEQAAAASNEVQAVQQSRLEACRDQNRRHRATIRDLRRIYVGAAGRHVPVAQRRELRASRRATATIINDIVPYRNCRAAVGVKGG